MLCVHVQDSTLLVTGSADKNIKFWGLDFGDCHKSIFAHDDSIMAVQVSKHCITHNSDGVKIFGISIVSDF